MHLDLKSSGKMSLKRPDAIDWEIVTPSPVQVRIDKNRVQVTSSGSTHIYKVSEMSQDQIASGIGLLTPWLTLDATVLSANYIIHQEGERRFSFAPKTEQPILEHMEVTLTQPGHIDRLKMYERSGDMMEIHFTTPTVVRTPP